MIMTDSFIQTAIRQQLSEGKPVKLQATGRSMRPYLLGTGNESVIVSSHTTEELKPGIIILFCYNNSYIFHRIIKKNKDRLIVQGDGNCIGTEVIGYEDVLAIVRFIIRPNGKKVSPYCFSAKAYWHIWYLLRPVRKYLLSIHNKLNP